MNKDNGGPAFPFALEASGVTQHYEPGMTLRDYFAAKAMQSLVAAFLSDQIKENANIESTAYKIADAMLAERAK